VKHRFLLDENILYHAVKGVDRRDNPDLTATELVRTISRNCHGIVVNAGELMSRYYRHIQQLFKVRSPALEPVFLLREILLKPEKCELEYIDPPELPPDARIRQREDIHVIRAALVSRPVIVSAEPALVEDINSQPALALIALTAQEALQLALEINQDPQA